MLAALDLSQNGNSIGKFSEALFLHTEESLWRYLQTAHLFQERFSCSALYQHLLCRKYVSFHVSTCKISVHSTKFIKALVFFSRAIGSWNFIFSFWISSRQLFLSFNSIFTVFNTVFLVRRCSLSHFFVTFRLNVNSLRSRKMIH